MTDEDLLRIYTEALDNEGFGLNHAGARRALFEAGLVAGGINIEAPVPDPDPVGTRPLYVLGTWSSFESTRIAGYLDKHLIHHRKIGSIQRRVSGGVQDAWYWVVNQSPHITAQSGQASGEAEACFALEDAIRRAGFTLLDWREIDDSLTSSGVAAWVLCSTTGTIVARIEARVGFHEYFITVGQHTFITSLGYDYARELVHERLKNQGLLLR